MKHPLLSVLELVHSVSLSVILFRLEGDRYSSIFSLLKLTVYFYISEVIIGKPRFFYTAAFTGALPVLQMPLESIKGRAGPLHSALSIIQFTPGALWLPSHYFAHLSFALSIM